MDNYVHSGNKSNSHQNPRKLLARLGYLERYIIEYTKEHMNVQAAAVRAWLLNKGIDVNIKRIHDAIQRLVKRGILEKVRYGVYRIIESVKNSILVSANNPKELDPDVSSRGMMEGGGGKGRDGGRALKVYRVHGYAGSFEEYVRRVWAAYKMLECVVRFFKKSLGYSRFRRIVRGVDVECVDVVGFGVHGVKGYHFKELKSPRYVYGLGLKPTEFGVDLEVLVSGVEKMFVKVYGGKNVF